MFLLSQLKFVFIFHNFLIDGATVALPAARTFGYSLVSHAAVFIQLITHFKSFIIVIDDPFHTH